MLCAVCAVCVQGAGIGRLTEEPLRWALAVFSGDGRCQQNVSLLSGKTLKIGAPASLTDCFFPSFFFFLLSYLSYMLPFPLCLAPFFKFPFWAPLLTWSLPQVLPIVFFHAPLRSSCVTLFRPILNLFISILCISGLCKKTHSLYYFHRQQPLMLVWTLLPSVLTSQINPDGWPNVPWKYSVKCSYIEIRSEHS